MALNVNRASTVAQPSFAGGVVVPIALGAVASAVLTDWARDEVFDVPFRGGDFLYGAAGGALTLTVLSGTTGRMLAAGMMAGGLLSTASNDTDLL